ncbi:hypothetical protein [Ferruginibacter sp.]|mgnify:CR=1 FL=1|nr:hypothetical protein [Ferruginibacter sp.]
MAENTEDEHLDNPANDQPENSSAEIIPTTYTATNTTNQEIENMEVHHHAHHEGKKNWRSYFWEFLMLFLAVFCGFLAEYQLEHKIERDRAKELAKSFYEELRNDSVTAALKVTSRIKQEAALGYLVRYFKDSSLTSVPKAFAINFEFGISFRTPTIFEPRTMMLDQLKNSGSLRYFKNETLQQLVGDLTVAIKNIYDRQDLETQQRLQYINPIIIQHYDYDFDAVMKKNGKTIFEGIQEYEKSGEIVPYSVNQAEKLDREAIPNQLNFYLGNVVSSTRQVHIQRYIEINAALLQLLRKEYHLK